MRTHTERAPRVGAPVEVVGKERVMDFLPNNLEWAPSSIVDLCKRQIEVLPHPAWLDVGGFP